MPNAIALLHLDEPDGVLLSDALSNLDDLTVDLDSTQPASVETYTGRGRQFVAADLTALRGQDRPGRDTILTRDMTVQAILSLDLVAGVQVLLARGLRSGAASERYSYGIELEQQADFAGYVEARWFWQDGDDNVRVQPGGVWEHAGDGALFLFTATRRWESSEIVVVRYYINGDMIAELESTDGDISGGTTGHFTLGARQNAGAWEGFLNGTLDELLITDHEMSPAEVRHTWLRLSEYQPGGLDAFVGLIPPGLPWAKDLGNLVGRHVRHAGESIGFANASCEELRALWLPNVAPLGQIEKWEGLCGLTAKPRDSLEVRQARVVAFMSRDEGFHLPSIEQALSGPLACTPEQVEIIENSNVQTDPFDELDLDERWLAADDSHWSADGELHLALPAGADLRWANVLAGENLRMPVDNDRGTSGLFASVKLAGYSLPADGGVGILLLQRRTQRALWFGVLKDGGVNKLGYRKADGATLGAFTPIVNPAAAAYWLRVSRVDDPSLFGVTYKLAYSTVGPNTGFASSSVIIGIDDFDWAGLGVFGTAAATGADLTADFDDWKLRCPKSVRPFYWFAYRDPSIPGKPDMIGARHVIKKLKPAHTFGSAIESKSVLAGDERFGLVFVGPCGVDGP